MELDAGPSLVTREFLAVVLAGFGHELYPLTSDLGEDVCPKALLPVANKPMIQYTLSWLEDSGIRDVLLICPSPHRAAISHYIHSDTSAFFSSLRIDLQTYDESPDTSVGTCTLLRHFSSRIPDDFVLLPCDFIPPPSLPLARLLTKFRTEAIMNASVVTSCWFQAHKAEKGTTPEEWGPLAPSVAIVWDQITGTLLHIDTPDAVDRNGEEIELRMGLLSRYPRSRLSSGLQDSGVYVCRHSVLNALKEKPEMDSFREEFMPWLCKVQYQRSKRDKYAKILNAEIATQVITENHSTLYVKSLALSPSGAMSEFSQYDTMTSMSMSLPASPTGSDYEEETFDGLRIGLLIHRTDAGPAARVNTIPAYLEMNRYFLSPSSYAPPPGLHLNSLIEQRSQISADSIVGNSTKVDERTTIKKSIIGMHCVIGKMVKISGCILMDHCVIADGVKLDGCILGKNTKVGTKAELVRCVTQSGYEVDANETLKNEKLDVSDWTAAQSSEEEDDDEKEDEDDDDEEDGSDEEGSDKDRSEEGSEEEEDESEEEK